MFDIEYLKNKDGQPKAVVIPIEIWSRLFPEEVLSLDAISEKIEDYCLNKAMDEAKATPLLDRESALQYLED